MSSQLTQIVHSMSVFLQNIPFVIAIKDLNSNYIKVSQYTEHKLGINIKALIGRADDGTPWECYAEQFRKHDLLAQENNYCDVFEIVPLGQDKVMTSRAMRSAITNDSGEVLGVINQIEVLKIHTELTHALEALRDIDQHSTELSNDCPLFYQVQEYPQNLQFTVRESECLFLLIRGKTAKEIGLFLNISPRTVESYIENIKIKCNVSKRSDIITKAIELGIVDIVPKQTISLSLYKNPSKWKRFLI